MSESTLESRSETSINWWPLILVFVGLVAFGNGVYGKFLFDDRSSIVENRAIQQLSATSWYAGTRTLLYSSLMLNYAVGGLNEFGYHVVNIGIHLVAGLALYGVARRTLELPQIPQEWSKNAGILAFFIAALWMTHPLQTQSVTYIVQRCEALMGMFFLLTLYCVIRAATATNRQLNWSIGAIVSLCLSALSKEVAITAPPVILLYDQLFLAGSWREVLRRRWGLYLAMVPVVLWMLSSSSTSFVVSGADDDAPAVSPAAGFGVTALTPWEYLRSQPAVILHYLRLVVWPLPQCLDYDWQIEDSPLRIYGFGLVILLLVLGSFWLYFRRSAVGWLGLSFFFVLAPTSSIVPIVDLAFEHRMYLPLAAVVALIVMGIYALMLRVLAEAGQAIRIATMVMTIMLVALVYRTMLRNVDYYSPMRMWQQVLAVRPNNSRARYIVAVLYDEAGQAKEAEKEYRLALKLAPGSHKNHYGYGRFLAAQGRREEALKQLEQAVELNPDYLKAWDALGNFYARQGDYEKAVPYYRKALAIDPTNPMVQIRLGVVLSKSGAFADSNELLRSALRADERNATAQAVLAWNLAIADDEKLRDGLAALRLAQASLQGTAGRRYEAHAALAAAFAELGQFTDAEEAVKEAISLAKEQGTPTDVPQLEALQNAFAGGRCLRYSELPRGDK